jgi:hypothetical protein
MDGLPVCWNMVQIAGYFPLRVEVVACGQVWMAVRFRITIAHDCLMILTPVFLIIPPTLIALPDLIEVATIYFSNNLDSSFN